VNIAKTRGCVLLAVSAHLIEIESHIAAGLVGMQITGLADTSVTESRDRVRSAIQNTGLEFPQKRITIGLSPAALPKHGSALDLAIAVALIASASADVSEHVTEFLSQTVWFGELALDGRVRPVKGVLLAAIAAAEAGATRIVVPQSQLAEARLVHNLEVIGISCLAAALNLLGSDIPERIDDALSEEVFDTVAEDFLDMSDVQGQQAARFALEVAAAGGHHIALLGSPGVGKTLLASRLPGILPPLDTDSALDVTAIASLGAPLRGLIRVPPFAAPHHTASYAALIGGGTTVPQLGVISRAHRGVLFLDEAPEFASNVLDALRLPLESGEVELNRRTFSLKLPAKFQLIVAANPCPCGYALDARSNCRCTPSERRRYLGKISGPLLDRIDIRVVVDPPAPHEMSAGNAESSESIRSRVVAARAIAVERLRGTQWRMNAEVPGPRLRELFPLPAAAHSVLTSSGKSQRYSPRGLDRIAQLAWTVSDLKQQKSPTPEDVLKAVELREAGGRWIS
jgi:magnesium chelatase family protein